MSSPQFLVAAFIASIRAACSAVKALPPPESIRFAASFPVLAREPDPNWAPGFVEAESYDEDDDDDGYSYGEDYDDDEEEIFDEFEEGDEEEDESSDDEEEEEL